MAVAIWVLLGLAYVWSVWKLARVSRQPDPWSADDTPRVDVVRATGKLDEPGRTTSRPRIRLVALRR
jgi:hypothetical protein